MSNILTIPTSGSIIFNDGTAGSSSVPDLTGNAVSLNYDAGAGLNITSYNTGNAERFSVDGTEGRLFSVSDSLTGEIFSVNDIAGLPLINVYSDTDDVITIGTYSTNALVVKNDKVGVGTDTPSEALTVSGNISASGNIIVNGNINNAGSDVLFDDDVQFDGTENTMPNQTLDAGDSSVMTLGLADARYGPIGKYEKDPGTITLQNSLAVATGSLFNGRLDQTFIFIYGAGAGAPPQIVFVPFFVVKPKNFTKAAINIVSGTSSTYDIDGCIYLPDENGYPLTRYGDVWAWDASATGKVEATINVGEIQGLFYVGIRPQVGGTDWIADAGVNLTVRGVLQSGGGIGMILNQMFNIVPQAFNQYDGSVGVTSTSNATSMPTDLSSPEIRRVSMWAAGNRHPSCILY